MNAPFPVSKEPLRFGDLDVDLWKNVAQRGGQTVNLTLTEAEVLYVLAARAPKGATLYHFDLGLYGALDAPEDLKSIVSWHVCKLRKKLAGLGVRIEPRRGLGYRLMLSPALDQAAA